MPYDSSLPADHAPIVAAELRNQFNGLNDLIEAQEARIAALEARLAAIANVAPMNLPFHDPVAQSDMGPVMDKFNELLTAAQ
jgi:hypothetical protein